MKNSSTNILAVSLAFPPLAYPRSIQVARLLRHSSASTVLFCADEEGARRDPTIEPLAERSLSACIRVNVPDRKADQYLDRFAYKLARRIWTRRNLVPDKYGIWRREVIKAVLRFLKSSEFEPAAIVTFAQPFSAHLIGLELRSRLGLPWLAHFSDPWVDNPFSPFDQTAKEANLRLERTVAENADVLAFTSMDTIDLFYSKYPPEFREKARLLPQSFDPEEFSTIEGPRPEKITIRYLGNFYGDRTPRPLILALKEVDQRSPDTLKGVSFELIGSGNADEIAQMSRELPAGLITTRPSVAYRESLELMVNADGLLVIDAPAEMSVFLPSKLVDYLGARRPVLGITPPGAARTLIRHIGGLVADPSDIGEVARSLELFVQDLRRLRDLPMTVPGIDDGTRDRYTAKRVASDFDRMLDEITGTRGPDKGVHHKVI